MVDYTGGLTALSPHARRRVRGLSDCTAPYPALLPALNGGVSATGVLMNARDLLGALLDPGTFRSWDTGPADVRPGPAYAAVLAAARKKTGLDESVITGMA